MKTTNPKGALLKITWKINSKRENYFHIVNLGDLVARKVSVYVALEGDEEELVGIVIENIQPKGEYDLVFPNPDNCIHLDVTLNYFDELSRYKKSHSLSPKQK